MKKILHIFTLVAGVLLSASVFSAASVPLDSNTIFYSTDAKKTVDSDTALVLVTVNATAVAKDPQATQAAAIATVKSYLPKAEWQVVNVKQSQAASGAENLIVELQVRLGLADVSVLSKKIQSAHVSNQKVAMKVVSYDPTDAMIRTVMQQLMIEVYQEVQGYVVQFNQATDSHYRIQSIRYSHVSSRIPIVRLEAGVGGTSRSNKQRPAGGLSVAKDVQLSAYVTLVEDPGASENKPKGDGTHLVGGGAVLPPTYLKVKGFKQCLSTKNMGTWKAWCLPKKKLPNCEQASWEQLQTMGISPC